MTLFACALTLILSCGAKSAAALNVSHAAVSLADTYFTQRSYDICRVMTCGGQVEANTLTRPFQQRGKPIAFQATLVGVSLTAFVAQRMRNSHNRVLRRIWWLPQTALIGASAFGAQSQAAFYGAARANCGIGCALAPGR